MSEPSREAYKVGQELYYLLERAGKLVNQDRAAAQIVDGWVRNTVQPIIDEREAAVSRQFELEEGWRERLGRFLRRLSRLVEES